MLLRQSGCKGTQFLRNCQILNLKSDIRTVVKRIIALGKSLGGLERANIERVVGFLFGKLRF